MNQTSVSHAPDALALVVRTRRSLLAQVLLQAVLASAATALLVLAIGRMAQPWLDGDGARMAWRTAAALSAAAALAASLWLRRQAWDGGKVALWIEEQLPSLRYALLALFEAHHGSARLTPAHASRLRQQLAGVVFRNAGTDSGIAAHGDRPNALRPHLRQRARKALAGPALLLGAALLLHAIAWAGLPGWLAARWASPPAAGQAAAAGADRLASIAATLTPPAYTGWPAQTLDEVDSIRGLAGSHIELHGQGRAQGIAAQLERQTAVSASAPPPEPLTARERADGQGWALDLGMPERPAALLLSHADTRRAIVLEPVADAAPLVRLHLPERDITLPDTSGTIELSASLSDDIGLAKGWFELIVASGEGEGNYVFTTHTLLETELGGERGSLGTRVALDGFGLLPGGQLSIRAVGMDGNDLTGPGLGYSETRTIRIAREQAQDEAEINPAPPILDESLMSLRMLIRLTERLDAQRDGMERATFVREAAPLARHAETIRQKIQVIVDETSMGGSFPVPPLLNVALDAMWEASRYLAVAETGEALPHLHRAHEAMKALTNLSRYFFRGESLPAHADVEGVRMSGEEPVTASERSHRPRQDSARQRLASQLRDIQPLLQGEPLAAQESLALLRVQALAELPEAAPLIERILDALRRQQDAGAPWADLQQRLAGTPQAHPRLPAWTPLPAPHHPPPPPPQPQP